MVRPPYGIALKLSLIAQELWEEIEGYATLHGGDLNGLSPARFFNAIYAFCINRLAQAGAQRDQFDYELTKPVPGLEEQAVDVSGEMAAFGALASATAGS